MTTSNDSFAAIFAAVAGGLLKKDNIASAIKNEDSEQNTDDDDKVKAVKKSKNKSKDDNQSNTGKEKIENSGTTQTSVSDKLELKDFRIKNREDSLPLKTIKSEPIDESERTENETKEENPHDSSLQSEDGEIGETIQSDLKAKINTIIDLAAKFRENSTTNSSLSVIPTTSSINNQDSIQITNSTSENSNQASNPFFYPTYNSNSIAVSKKYQIQETTIKALTSNSKKNSTSNDLSVNKAKSGLISNGVNSTDNSNRNGNVGGCGDNTTNMDSNNYIMDLSSNNPSMNISAESHVIPVDPSAITNLNSPPLDINPMPPTKRRKRSNWNVETEKAFVKYWRQYYTELKKSKRTSVVYQKIADELNKFGLSLTCRDVQVKTHNMTQKYRFDILFTILFFN